MAARSVIISTADSVSLTARHFAPPPSKTKTSKGTIVFSSATAVPQVFYQHFATYVAEQHGYDVWTYDLRGMAESRSPSSSSLRGSSISIADWSLLDMPAVVQHALDYQREQQQEKDTSALPLYLIGHSLGGQVAGMLPPDLSAQVDAMVTISSQSGYWKLQGKEQKYAVALHMHVTFPLMTAIFGYFPFRLLGQGEDLPPKAALQWASWCRSPNYLLDDPSMPLERYQQFQAPVLAYSIDDDTWGTKKAVDSFMLQAYPNVVRRHLVPREHGVAKVGHFGFFRDKAKCLWSESIEWLEVQTQAKRAAGLLGNASIEGEVEEADEDDDEETNNAQNDVMVAAMPMSRL